jgi:3-hydroxybutyryl-CoA dehydrogenase
VAQHAPDEIVLHGHSAAVHALADRLFERNIPHTWGEANDGRIAETGGAVIFVTDGRTATQRATEMGIANVVLIDLALDYATAGRIAVGAAINCFAPAVGAAISLLQAAGFEVCRLGDTPGLAVMRTVAMLANEAADAVNQGVCDAAGADAAMKLGVNYPRGPLEWADRVGLPAICAVLANLARFYGEDRYRVSPLIQQRVFAGKKIHD